MKNKIFAIASLLFLTIITNSCDDMNELHQEYLDRGTQVYIGKPDSVMAKAGFNNLRLIWTNNADAKIKKTRIIYNYGKDSITIPFDRKVTGFQKDSIDIKLDPGDYLFDIYNLTEDEKLKSIAVEGILGKVYGESYKNTLATRAFTPKVDFATSSVTLMWGDITSDYIYSVVKYTDHSSGSPVQKEIICNNNTYNTVIEDIRGGDSIIVTSAYIPETNYIGILESPEKIIHFSGEGLLERSKHARYVGIPFDNMTHHAAWTIFENMFDGDYGSAWLSNLGDRNSANGNQMPVSFTIDLTGSIPVELNRFQYFMAHNWDFKEYSAKKFEVWGTDEIKEGMPDSYWATIIPGDWQNDWQQLIDCELMQPSGGDNTSVTEEDIAFARKGFSFDVNPEKKKIRYIRILVHKTCDGSISAGIGELFFYGKVLSIKD